MKNLLVAHTLFCLVAGCTARSSPDAGRLDAEVRDAPAVCPTCEGATAISCSGARETCDALCTPGVGCEACRPSTRFCRSSTEVHTCNEDGTSSAWAETCEAGAVCAAGRCIRPCDPPRDGEPAETPSTGCEFYAVPTLNSSLGSQWRQFMDFATLGADGFHYAVALANPQGYEVTVRITGPDVDRTFVLGPGQLRTEVLPWIPLVSQTYPAGVSTLGGGVGPFRGDPSTLARDGSYHIESNAPIVAYQFNPLNYYDDDPRHIACARSDVFECHSFSNDASLLLPVRGLGRNYTVATIGSPYATNVCPPDEGVGDMASGYVTIVGTTDEDTEVSITPTTPIRPGTDHARLSAGETVRFRLGRGDVLQLVADRPTDAECDPMVSEHCEHPCRATGDLTGTRIVADHPVVVFAGHACATVPLGQVACDHLEDQLWPDEALGRRYTIVPAYAPRGASRILTVARVVASRDGTHVTFRPGASGVHAADLDAGEHVELEIRGPIEVEADAPVAVAELLVGQALTAPGGLSSDPSLVIAVPEEQWRTDYPILVPATYDESWLIVAAPNGTLVTLDGTRLEPSEHTDRFEITYLRVAPGSHWLNGTLPFTVLVVGHGPFVSYAYPGGGNLTTLD